MMDNERIVNYVSDMIIDNLAKRDYWTEAFRIKADGTNKTLIAHIDGLIELFQKAKEILEDGDYKDE